MNKIWGIFAVTALVSSANAFAEPKSAELMKDYYTIGSVETYVADEGEVRSAKEFRKLDQNLKTNNVEFALLTVTDSETAGGALADEIGALAGPEAVAIINLGKKAWDFVKANQPVVNAQFDSASAMPDGITDWKQLENWQPPKSRLYQIVYKNLYGMEVIRLNYRVMFTYGGSLNGKGAYLTQVKVLPAEVIVSWGFTLNATAQVPQITNAGTTDAPIGGAEILVKWDVSTVLQHQEGSSSYYVRGDGLYMDLSNGTQN